jgi:NarL family two-component system sensor histidine kinase YdfH
MAKQKKIIYNSYMSTTPESPRKASDVDRDPRLFTWFLTMVMIFLYIVALLENPILRQPWLLILFTVLFIIHVLLHWQIEIVIKEPRFITGYFLLQGALGFAICSIARNQGVLLGIYMALLGETVGMLGLSRSTLLAVLYYAVLAVINYRQFETPDSIIWLLVATIPVTVFTLIYVILYRRQAGAREEAQKLAQELEIANQQLSQYVDQVEDLTIANERQRMARELHDTLSQGLTGIILQLEAVEAHLAKNNTEKAQSIISNAMIQARATLADARDAIDDLRSTKMDDLNAALHLEVSRFINATDIPCQLQSDALPALPENVIDALVCSITEGLTNIARHAQARQVTVQATTDEQNLVVLIKDDGQGFNPQTIPAGHYGLLGIRERMRWINGECAIESEKGKGTTLIMRVPL